MINEIVWQLNKFFPVAIDIFNGYIAKICFANKFASFVIETIIGYNIF